MNEKELAKKSIQDARMAKETTGIAAVILDILEYFQDKDFQLFKDECKKLGFKVLPLEQTIFKEMKLRNKVVVMEITEN